MKATELMVKDWVETNYGTAQVSAIYDEHHFAFIKDGIKYDVDDRIDGEWFKPIGLTPEIYEMNGFVKDDENILNLGIPMASIIYSNYKMAEDVEIKPGLKRKYVNNGELGNICFVHQLQQMLRLTDYKDLANNFKVPVTSYITLQGERTMWQLQAIDAIDKIKKWFDSLSQEEKLKIKKEIPELVK